MAIQDVKPTPTKLEDGEPDRQSSTDSDIDLEAEKKLVRKLDWHIVPMVMLLYLFSFLDRFVRYSVTSVE